MTRDAPLKLAGEHRHDGLAHGDIQEYFGHEGLSRSQNSQGSPRGQAPLIQDQQSSRLERNDSNKEITAQDLLDGLYAIFDEEYKDKEFDLGQLLQLIKQNSQQHMSAMSGALQLYLVDRYQLNLTFYVEVMKMERFDVARARKRIEDTEMNQVVKRLRQMEQDFNSNQ